MGSTGVGCLRQEIYQESLSDLAALISNARQKGADGL
jgi:hypothetical protein